MSVEVQREHSEKEAEIVAAAYVNPSLNNGNNFQLMMHDLNNTDPNCRDFFSKQLETQEWVDELKIIQNAGIPVMYILGEEDGFINSQHYRDFLVGHGLKKSQIHLIKGARHIPQLDDPKLTVTLITDFTSKNDTD